MEKAETQRMKQARRSKREIIGAYIELVKEVGVDNFTINDICDRLNISIGRFYHHFKSKDDVLMYMYFGMDDFMEAHPIPEELSTLEKIVEHYALYAEYNAMLGLGFCQKYFSGKNPSFGTVKKPGSAKMALHGLLERFIAEYRVDGRYSPEELHRYFELVSRGVIFDWSTHGGEYELVPVMRQMIGYLLKGLLSDRTIEGIS